MEKGGGWGGQHNCWLTVQTLYVIHIQVQPQREYHKDTCKTEGGLLFRSSFCVYVYIYVFVCLNVKYPFILSHFINLFLSSTDFSINTQNSKFHKNPSSGRWTVRCGRTARQTDRHGEVGSSFFFLQLCKIRLKKLSRCEYLTTNHTGSVLKFQLVLCGDTTVS